MNKLSALCASLLFCMVLTCFGEAETASAQSQLKGLIKCLSSHYADLSAQLESVTAESDEARARHLMSEKSAYDRALQSARTLEIQMKTMDGSNLLQYVSRLQIPGTATECLKLQSSLSEALLEEQAAEGVRYAEKMERIKKNIGETLLKAEKLSDLDELFVYISHFNDQISKSQFRSEYSTELNNITRMVSQWQEYLAYLGTGDSRKALSAMNNIVNYSVNTPVVPRSTLVVLKLELEGLGADSNQKSGNKEAPHSLESVVASYQNLADLPKLREQLIELKKYNDTRNDASNLLSAVYKLERSMSLIQGGDALIAFTVLDDINTSYNKLELLGELKSQVAASALSGAVPVEYRVLTKGLSLVDALKVVAAKMRDTEEWLMLWELFKVMDLYFKRQGNQVIASLSNDISAIEYFLQAKAFEESGKLSDAMKLYERVLGKTGVYGPYEATKRSVRFLSEQRAEDLYADQKREAEVPRAVVTYEDPRLIHRGRPFDMNSQKVRDEIEQIVSGSVEKKIALYLAAEKEKVKKSDTLKK